MKDNTELNIVQQFMLLAHQPNKGGYIISGIYINYGIIGALLLDMSMEGGIIIENDRLVLKGNSWERDSLKSEISMVIGSARSPKKIKYWLSKLARKSRKYKWVVLNELKKARLLRIEDKKFLGLIPYRVSYLVDQKNRNRLIDQLRNDILSNRELSSEKVVVLGLIEACKMHKVLTSNKDELKKVRKQVKEIIKKSPIASSLDQTIKQVQVAIFASIAASTAAAYSGSH